MAHLTNILASHRQTIIFSSDDSWSLHIIVCYYRWGQNHCWAIWMLYGFKRQNTNLSVIIDLIMCIWAAMSYWSKSRKKIHCHYFYRKWQTHGETSVSLYSVKAQMTSTKAICLRFWAHHTPLTSNTVHWQELFMHKPHHSLTPQQTSGVLNMSLTSHSFIQPHQCKDNSETCHFFLNPVGWKDKDHNGVLRHRLFGWCDNPWVLWECPQKNIYIVKYCTILTNSLWLVICDHHEEMCISSLSGSMTEFSSELPNLEGFWP